MPSHSRSTTRPAAPTRALLIAAAFAALQTGLFLAVLPVLSVTAPTAPPVYALIAGVNTVLPFLARVVTRTPGTATITAAVAAVLVVALSPLGLIAAVPLLATGVVFDLICGRSSVSNRRLVVGAAVVAVVLFGLSLAVFSPEHLAPWMLAATLAGRLVGEGVAVVVVIAVARLLRRAGVAR